MKLVATIGKRILGALATVLAVSLLIYVGVEALPGDAVGAALGQQSTATLEEVTREDFGLDRPFTERYVSWLGGFVQGDLGKSLPSGEPVSEIIGDKVINSALLVGLTLCVLIPLSIVLGVTSAFWRDKAFDHLTGTTTLTLTSTPEFVVGSVLIVVFALGLGVLPAVSILNSEVSPLAQLELFLLPCATLVLVWVAQATRMIRATTIEVLQSGYVQSAVLRGTPLLRVLRKHVLPNAIGPTIQIFALTVAGLAGGIVVTETVFQFPGIGLALVNAVLDGDVPTVEAIGLGICIVYVFSNLLADVLVIALNPRMRRADGA